MSYTLHEKIALLRAGQQASGLTKEAGPLAWGSWLVGGGLKDVGRSLAGYAVGLPALLTPWNIPKNIKAYSQKAPMGKFDALQELLGGAFIGGSMLEGWHKGQSSVNAAMKPKKSLSPVFSLNPVR